MISPDIETDKIINEIGQTGIHQLPESKSEVKRLKMAFEQANTDHPLAIYAGSCPDYSHQDGLYTHQSLGSNVPLLSQVHLVRDKSLLTILENRGINYRYFLMVADVEATDSIFADKFTNGSQSIFLDYCYRSVQATADLAQKVSPNIISSSFFNQFGRERFLDYQQRYQKLLTERFEADSRFRMRVELDTVKRMDLYRKMYSNRLQYGSASPEDNDFLISRTIRTMAQYLTLGRLISQDSLNPLIINHFTRNNSMFNDRNKFLLPEDGPQPQPIVPVIVLKQAVY